MLLISLFASLFCGLFARRCYVRSDNDVCLFIRSASDTTNSYFCRTHLKIAWLNNENIFLSCFFFLLLWWHSWKIFLISPFPAKKKCLGGIVLYSTPRVGEHNKTQPFSLWSSSCEIHFFCPPLICKKIRLAFYPHLLLPAPVCCNLTWDTRQQKEFTNRRPSRWTGFGNGWRAGGWARVPSDKYPKDIAWTLIKPGKGGNK